jgi:hypothetical protein
MWIMFAVGFFVIYGDWKIGGLWLLLALIYVGLAWRAARKQKRPA